VNGRPWRIGVDAGGTFTDAIVWNVDTGDWASVKVLSTADDPAEAFVAAVRRLLEEQAIAVDEVGYVVHGTTVATNAVIEGKLARTALVTNAGFRDILEIARQVRANPYDVFAEKPRPLVPRERCHEVTGRVAADGSELTPLDEEGGRAVAGAIADQGVDAVAVCLLHAYRNPEHERRLGALLRKALPGIPVTLSHEVAAEFREYPRACTAAVNAGLVPLVGRYLRRIQEALERAGIDAELRAMQSNGGVLSFQLARARPVYLLESGPAAGVIGTAYLGVRADAPDLISFDMGGTTAKLGLVRAGQPQMTAEFEVGKDANQAREWFPGATGYPILVPAVDLVEVGAGGGSIAWVDSGGKLRVGPRSAGASPGPACYGFGGREPTITDANLVLGRLDPDYFLGGELRLDVDAAHRAVGHVAAQLGATVVETALGIVDIANAAMVRAMRIVSVQRGYDPRTFTLVAFGGAGPVHAAALAEHMHIPRVLVQPRPGVASALGLLVTDVRHELSQTRIEALDAVDPAELEAAFAELERRAARALDADGIEAGARAFGRRVEMRYVGQSYQLAVPLERDWLRDGRLDELERRFHATHEAAYGYSEPSERTELVTLRLTAVGTVAKPELSARGPVGVEPAARRRVCFGGRDYVDATVLERARLGPGAELAGPAIVEERDSTTVVPPGWVVTVDGSGNLILERWRARPAPDRDAAVVPLASGIGARS
jgi:N-methylhydantoinase A